MRLRLLSAVLRALAIVAWVSAAEAETGVVAAVDVAAEGDAAPVILPASWNRSDGRPLFEPYGSLWGRMVATTSRTNPGSFTLWVFSAEEQGEGAFAIDARSSRLGVRINGPTIDWGYQLGGRVEVDFFDQFLTENVPGVRMRHAYLEATDERWRFLVGQTWDVVSPLMPGTLNFSVGWGGGNIGFRRAQFRVERKLKSSHADWLVQGSLNQDIIPDFRTDPGVRRESAGYPVLQGRLAASLPADSDRPATIGLSGHLGETGFDFISFGPPPLHLPPADDGRFKTWSFNLDVELPITRSLTLRGEYFQGANLSPFLGGIGQGVCPCLRREIRSYGGWLELVQHWSPSWESHAGMGIDDPRDSDSLLGRTQNNFLFANLIWHISDGLSTGWELGWWRTLYQERRAGLIPASLLTPSAPGEAFTFEWMVRYDL